MNNKRKHRPEYEALVLRVQAGEITRQRAAELAHEQTGLSEQTFLSWITSSGSAKLLRDQRGSAGANSIHSHARNDPDKAIAYEEAVAAALASRGSVKAVYNKFAERGVSYVHLASLVRKARPPRPQSLPPKEDLVQAIMVASRAHLSS